MDSVLIIENKPDIVWLSETSINDRINSNHYRSYMTKNELEIKNSGLEVLRIKDIVVKIRRGKGLKKDDSGEIPNYKVRNLTNFGINKDDVDLITHREFVNNKSSHIKIGDVLLASTGVGSLGKVDLFFDDIKATVDGHITILTTKEEYDGGYLKAYLQSRYGQIFIEQNTIGSTGQTELYAKDIGEILIPIPSPKIQKYIGDKVRRAEELREEARRLKNEAEQIFETDINLKDIVSKSNSKERFYWKNNDELEQRIDMKYNSIDMEIIREHFSNYKTIKLQDAFKLISGYSFSSDMFNGKGNSKIVKIGNLNTYGINVDDLENIDIGNMKNNVDKFICENGDILYAMTGATLGNSSIFIKDDKINAYVNQRVLCFKQKKDIPTGYLLMLLNSYIGRTISFCLSTGVAQPNISIEDLRDISVPIIDKQKMNKIHDNLTDSIIKINKSKKLIQQAKQDVEDLIEGNFDMSKLNDDSSTESRC